LVTAPIAIVLFFAWTTALAIVMLVLAMAWRLWLAMARRSASTERWHNPAQRVFIPWAWGVRFLAATLWGVRLRREEAYPEVGPGEVALALMTHGPAIPAILQLTKLVVETADCRFLAPTKHDLTPVLLWPGVAAGMLLPLNREGGESSAETLARELATVPLGGTVLAIFPEGHRPRRKHLVASASRARRYGYEPLRRHVEPRPRGAHTMAAALAQRAEAEGLELKVFFGTYVIDRPGWGERLGPLHTMGATVSSTWEDVTGEVLERVSDRTAFSRWLRSRFERADASMPCEPFLWPVPFDVSQPPEDTRNSAPPD
jgi:1-acyl-sn-glycerol-3-phosphate acyltransferase